MKTKLKPHPLSQLFPLMEASAFRDFVTNIKQHGQQDPILLFEGKILDGRNRYAACLELQLEPNTKAFEGDSAQARQYVVSANLHRRHLNESQRAMVAEKLATERHGGSKKQDDQLITLKSAAQLMNVSKPSVIRARKVRQQAIPKVVKSVESGTLAVSVAAKIAAQPKEKQALFISRNGQQACKALFTHNGAEAGFVNVTTLREWFKDRYAREKAKGNSVHPGTMEYMIDEYETRTSE